MYKHVLIPVSFEEDRDARGAIEIAQTLADENTKITLLHVIEQIPAHVMSFMPDGFANDRKETIKFDLSVMAQKIPNAEAKVVLGHSSRGILDWAAANNPDCIVIASHKPEMQDLLLGSTAAKVVRHAKCAVHVLR